MDPKGRRRSLSTGDLSVTAEMSVEMDSDRSTCFSAGDPEVGIDLVDSDFEAERLSNLEEEDNDLEVNDQDADSQQSSVEIEFGGREDKELKRRINSSRFVFFFIEMNNLFS